MDVEVEGIKKEMKESQAEKADPQKLKGIEQQMYQGLEVERETASRATQERVLDQRPTINTKTRDDNTVHKQSTGKQRASKSIFRTIRQKLSKKGYF